jgi:hypothetical protein
VTLISRFDHKGASQKYQNALDELNLSQDEPGFWLEWIETRFTWIEALYWQQDSVNLDKLLEQTKDIVEQHGTLKQRIDYRRRVISSAFVRERYLLGHEHMSIGQENVALAIESGDSYQISVTKRQLGMVAYCADQFDIAESSFREAIELSEKNRDFSSLIIAQVYLSITHRRMQREKAVLADTKRILDLLKQGSTNPQYEAVIKANLAWLAYREGSMKKARQQAQSALDIWKKLSSPYAIQWIALFPMLAIRVEEQKLDDALSLAQALLKPPQQRLNSEVESALIFAQQADPADKELCFSRFEYVFSKARETGYL